MSAILAHMVWPSCEFMMPVSNVLHTARWKYRTQKIAKKSPKNRHLCTIAQLCRAISSQLRHVSTIRKKLIKQQYVLQLFSQYGELRSTSGWDRFRNLGHPYEFQRVSRGGAPAVGSAKLCGVEQRAPPIFGRATITLGIGPHSSFLLHFAWFVDDAKCILVMHVCVSVCLWLAAFSHYCTDTDVTRGNGRG